MQAASSHVQLPRMATWGSKQIVLLAASLLVEIGGMQVCFAAPPGATPQGSIPRPHVTGNLTQNVTHFLPARLDLRAPSHAAAIEENPAAFPSALIHRQSSGAQDTAQLPSLGAGNPRLRPPLAELARHIQHEGLPVARLWENNSALVHIGLNQRGKPGLWLVQKIH
ncbi:MAG: hypothetical protein QOF42_3401 [Gammaproteobacteria bacterium]|nr:hypothetical protein [Gammaproteobacteria bacterium]